MTIGGRGQAVGAFNAETGTLAWKAGDLGHSPASQVLESVAWTPPTLAGHTLYIRDRRSIVALDVGTS